MSSLTVEELMAMSLKDILELAGSADGTPVLVKAKLEGVPFAVLVVQGNHSETLQGLMGHFLPPEEQPAPSASKLN